MKLYHLGRGLDNEIVVSDDSVSRVHAQLFQEDDQSTYIIDLNSTNGTFVNGHKVDGRQSLRSGDVLMLGTKRVEWEGYLEKQEKPSMEHHHDIYEEEDSGRKSKTRPILIAAGVLLLAAVAVFIWLGSPLTGSSQDPIGKWSSKTDPSFWIEFEKEGKYQEGYGTEVILDNATWEKKGDGSVFIKRGGILVLYTYEVKNEDLTLGRNNQEEEYQKSEGAEVRN
jgi:hypothetical protein